MLEDKLFVATEQFKANKAYKLVAGLINCRNCRYSIFMSATINRKTKETLQWMFAGTDGVFDKKEF